MLNKPEVCTEKLVVLCNYGSLVFDKCVHCESAILARAIHVRN